MAEPTQFPDEQAREVALRLVKSAKNLDPRAFLDIVRDALDAARQRGYREGVYEAAKWIAPNFPGTARDMVRALTPEDKN